MNIKSDKYAALLSQIPNLIDKNISLVSNLASVSAVLKDCFDFFWVGFYIVDGDRLVIGPYQGPLACVEIFFGKGVCGACWEKGEAILVPDVHSFEGHISCNSDSKSEIVVPVFGKDDKVAIVLDIDSAQLDAFDDCDMRNLKKLGKIIETVL